MSHSTLTWQEAVALTREVRLGTVRSYVSAGIALAEYLLSEQEAIDRALAETSTVDVIELAQEVPFPPEAETARETPKARVTLPMIPDEPELRGIADDLDEIDTDPAIEAEPRTGVLGAPDTGIRPRAVLEIPPKEIR